jgi:Zn-dependent peptidase ImmA (M78 family)
VVGRRALGKESTWKGSAARRLQAAAGGPERVEEAIEKLVTDLLAGLVCPPTDLEAVGRRIGVASILSEPLPASGELRRNGKAYIVACATELPPARRRFTIAHEFGHILIERCGGRNVKDNAEVERLCDAIASEILLPTKVFVERAPRQPSPQDVLEIARIFQTSVTATARRFHQLRKTNVFLASGGDVEWGFGVVRPGRVEDLDTDLRVLIQSAAKGKSISGRVFINSGVLSAGQWHASAVWFERTDSMLFTLHPVPRDQWVRPS